MIVRYHDFEKVLKYTCYESSLMTVLVENFLRPISKFISCIDVYTENDFIYVKVFGEIVPVMHVFPFGFEPEGSPVGLVKSMIQDTVKEMF